MALDPDLATHAAGIAGTIFRRRAPRHLQEDDDARPDLILYVLARLHQFDPSRANLNTWVARIYSWWVAGYHLPDEIVMDPHEITFWDGLSQGQPGARISSKTRYLIHLAPKETKEVVLMRYALGMQWNHIAEIQGISLPTARKYAARGIAAIKDALTLPKTSTSVGSDE